MLLVSCHSRRAELSDSAVFFFFMPSARRNIVISVCSFLSFCLFPLCSPSPCCCRSRSALAPLHIRFFPPRFFSFPLALRAPVTSPVCACYLGVSGFVPVFISLCPHLSICATAVLLVCILPPSSSCSSRPLPLLPSPDVLVLSLPLRPLFVPVLLCGCSRFMFVACVACLCCVPAVSSLSSV